MPDPNLAGHSLIYGGRTAMHINDKNVFDKENVFGLGQPNSAYAQFFTGNSYLNPLTEAGNVLYF